MWSRGSSQKASWGRKSCAHPAQLIRSHLRHRTQRRRAPGARAARGSAPQASRQHGRDGGHRCGGRGHKRREEEKGEAGVLSGSRAEPVDLQGGLATLRASSRWRGLDVPTLSEFCVCSVFSCKGGRQERRQGVVLKRSRQERHRLNGPSLDGLLDDPACSHSDRRIGARAPPGAAEGRRDPSYRIPHIDLCKCGPILPKSDHSAASSCVK